MNHHFRNLVRVVIRVVIISQGAPCEKGEVHIWSFLFWSLECKENKGWYIKTNRLTPFSFSHGR